MTFSWYPDRERVSLKTVPPSNCPLVAVVPKNEPLPAAMSGAWGYLPSSPWPKFQIVCEVDVVRGRDGDS